MARNPSSSVRSKNTRVQESKRAAKVQSLLTYRETALSEKAEAIFRGKPKAQGCAFHGYICANFRAPAQAPTCLVFGHKTLPRALGRAPSQGGGRESELAQPFNINPTVSYPVLQMSLCRLLNLPSPIAFCVANYLPPRRA